MVMSCYLGPRNQIRVLWKGSQVLLTADSPLQFPSFLFLISAVGVFQVITPSNTELMLGVHEFNHRFFWLSWDNIRGCLVFLLSFSFLLFLLILFFHSVLASFLLDLLLLEFEPRGSWMPNKWCTLSCTHSWRAFVSQFKVNLRGKWNQILSQNLSWPLSYLLIKSFVHVPPRPLTAEVSWPGFHCISLTILVF